MPYYMRGDYRTGGYGYPMGDPGFLSSLWKGIKKVAAPIIGGMIGGPIGAAAGGMIGGKPSFPGTPPIAPQVPASQEYYTRFGPITGWQKRVTPVPQMGFRGAMPVARGRTTAVGPTPDGCPPRGYHWAKDGSGRIVRNRRMNVANPRALRRAMRRVQGFEKLARRTITFTRRTKMKKR